jgi:hypothetical protein
MKRMILLAVVAVFLGELSCSQAMDIEPDQNEQYQVLSFEVLVKKST